jgi:hypothetical protein
LRCGARSASDARVAFEGDSRLLGRDVFPYESTVRRAPSEMMDTGNGTMVMSGEGLYIGGARHDLTQVVSGHRRR